MTPTGCVAWGLRPVGLVPVALATTAGDDEPEEPAEE